MVNELTVDSNGLEANFATNTLATYVLTECLLPALKKSSDPRVIVVSSGGMLVQKLDSSDPMLVTKQAHFDGTMVYAQNKRQQVVLCELWAHSHPEIVFASMHPGWADTPVS
ncbi:Dehydrogenase/reductase SDR family member 12 [Fasciola gigantica]|uniref:Dehydrogenase/reductase SDR family member 12 n=1 Tax=Fasciola gigantica TaxID=46835 RepID=A0A504Z3R9_FASGI|nr:Dehydrogenase/reductase SDR family member 12 [Fasciola gigantica]